MRYIGIDPGSKGFATLMEDGKPIAFASFQLCDQNALAEFFRSHADCKVCMEEVHALYGSSAKSTFAFGEINGFLKGLFTANQIPYTLVQPKKWQKEIWVTQDMVYDYKVDEDGNGRKVVNTKQTSINAAKRLFPGLDLRRTQNCKNIDDNKVDSILIAEYARRINL